jgi:RNA polymerase II subunit A C-terminal domain phosphatase SSU72
VGVYVYVCFQQQKHNYSLPGRTAMEPRIFKFGTSYEAMYQNLTSTPDDTAYFARTGVLSLCQRGAAVKKGPQRWQDVSDDIASRHDVVIAFEERIFDAIIEDLQLRQPTQEYRPIHVICLDTKDNPHEAAIQGQVALDLCWRLEQQQQQLQQAKKMKKGKKMKIEGDADDDDEDNEEDLAVKAPVIIDQFQKEREMVTPIKILYQVCYL